MTDQAAEPVTQTQEETQNKEKDTMQQQATQTPQAPEQEMILRDQQKSLEKSEQTLIPLSGSIDMFLDPEKFEQGQRAGKLLASSTLVPDHYKGNLGNCFVALALAKRMDTDVFLIMQKTYCVHGKIGFEAQLVIALANTRGPFAAPIDWEEVGKEGTDSWGFIAYAPHKKSRKVCKAICTVALAKKNGWWDKKDSKWPIMTETMLKYRSATILARLYCPEVLLGMQTVDEIKDYVTIDAEYEEKRAAEAPAIPRPAELAAPRKSAVEETLDLLPPVAAPQKRFAIDDRTTSKAGA